MQGQHNPFAFVVGDVAALRAIAAGPKADPAGTDSAATGPLPDAQAPAPATPADGVRSYFVPQDATLHSNYPLPEGAHWVRTSIVVSPLSVVLVREFMPYP